MALANIASTGFDYGNVMSGREDWRTNSHTVMARVRWSAAGGDRRIVHQLQTGGVYVGFDLKVDTSQRFLASWVHSWSSSAVQVRTNSGYGDGAWHHVAGTLLAGGASGTPVLYVDGVAVAQTIVVNNLTGASASGVSLLVGWWLNNSFTFVGDIEDVRMYSRALSAAEILTIANSEGRDGIVQDLIFAPFLGINGVDAGPSKYTATSIGSPTFAPGVLRRIA